MSDFTPAITTLLDDEGSGYNPEDHGQGPSKWGITLRSYREFYPIATEADIQALTLEAATAFYRDHRWNRYHLGLIEDQALATKVFNMLANMGAGGNWHTPDGVHHFVDGAITLLQEAAGVAEDGILGPQSAAVINSQNPQVLLGGYRTLLIQHYEEILNAHPEWENDRAGWMARARA